MELGARSKVGSEVLRPKRLAPGARSHPGSPRARLRAPRRVADNAHEEEEGVVSEVVMRGGGDRAGTSQFKGVSWDKERKKWRAQCKEKFLGLHTTEEDAARAYIKYIKDGSVPGAASTSQFTGVSWNTNRSKWQTHYKGTYLGLHTTEEGAARAYSKYVEDGIDPVEHRGANTSQFTGVSWHKNTNKWQAGCKGKHLGLHTAEEDATRTYRKYQEDGIAPVKHRDATSTSQFAGISWVKNANKWKVTCTSTYLGLHTTEEAAARAYNVEAERVGRPLNVIPAAGAAGAGVEPKRAGAGAGGGAGPKRAAPKTPAAPATSKKAMRAAPTTLAAPAPGKKMLR